MFSPDKNSRVKSQRGRLKRTKYRTLLERLRYYQNVVLCFMVEIAVPFTNKQGEDDQGSSKDIRVLQQHAKCIDVLFD